MRIAVLISSKIHRSPKYNHHLKHHHTPNTDKLTPNQSRLYTFVRVYLHTDVFKVCSTMGGVGTNDKMQGVVSDLTECHDLEVMDLQM